MDTDSDSDNSQGGNAGVISPADCNVSQLSPPSNDSGNVGKSMANAESSDAPKNNISHLSDGTTSSQPEAEGNLNGEKRNDEPSSQHEGLSINPNSTSSNGNDDYHQKPNGYYNPNGLHSEK